MKWNNDRVLKVFDQSWQMRTLPSGLRLVHIPLQQDERFYLGVTLAAGARYETAQNSGVAHFLEHMMFRGSRKFPDFMKLAQAFEWLGGEWNAATGHEHTEYWFSGNRSAASEVVPLFADFMIHPRLNDLEIERDVIKKELQKELNEYGHSTDLDYHTLRQIWPESRLANPILGSLDNINNVTMDMIRDYRARHYHPATTVVTVVGGTGDDGILDLLEESFRDYRSLTSHRAAHPPAIRQNFRGPKVQWINHPDNEYHVQLSFPCGGEHSGDSLHGVLTSRILGDGFSSRLMSNLREKRGLVYEINAGTSLYSDVGTLDITASVGSEQLIEFFQRLFQLLGQLRDKGPTLSEVTRAKRRSLMDMELLPSDPETLGFRWSWFLLNGKKPELVKSAHKLMGVERDDIGKFCAKVFRPAKMSLSILGPQQVTLQKQLGQLIKKGF